MQLRAIATPHAPEAIGPYSQAVAAGPWLFCSGQIPLDPATGELVAGDIQAQTRRVFANLAAVLAEPGLHFTHVVKTTAYLTDLADFSAFNAVYAEHFVAPFPARATVGVAALPKGAAVEVELVAVLPGAGAA
jgi:2-iminobutanoate/2-iminopropanoate deaminase